MYNSDDVIKKIKQIKKERKLTNDTLSAISGVPKGTLSKILGNETKDPQFSAIARIYRALNLSVDSVIFGEEDPLSDAYSLDNKTKDISEKSIMSKQHIASVLKRLRTKSGLTADEVGKMVGKSGKTVNGWENARSQPETEILFRLFEIYNVADINYEFKERDLPFESREDYIKAKIAEQGHTIKSFAAKIDMPYSTLLSILKGSIGGAAVDNAIKICKGLGITISELQSLAEPTSFGTPMPSFNEDETKVLSLYKELSSHDQGRVLGYIEQLHDNMLAKEKIKIAARNGSFNETIVTNDDVENISNLPDVDDV